MTAAKHPIIPWRWTHPEFEYLAHNTWVWTEKVDGTNIRVTFNPFTDGGEVDFGGRTDDAQIPVKLLQALKNLFSPKIIGLLHDAFPEGAIFYGEGYGPKIQKCGGLYHSDPSFVLFDIKVGYWWLQRHSLEDIAAKLDIDVVPIIGRGTLYEAIETTKAGFQSDWGNFLAEGMVLKPKVEMLTRAGGRIITKLKHADFQGIDL